MQKNITKDLRFRILKFNSLNRIIRLGGWLAVALGLFYGVWAGWEMAKSRWPGLHDDGVLYSTTIINRAADLGNRFSVYTPAIIRNGGDNSFRAHGQLYQACFAALLYEPNYYALLFEMHFVNVFGFLASFTVFYLVGRRVGPWSRLVSLCFGLAGGYATAACMIYLQGRPEHGVPVVLLAFGLIRELSKDKSLPNWIQGIQIGLIASISPLPGIIFGSASVVALGLRAFSTASFLSGAITQFVSTLITWVVAMALVYEGSLIYLIQNTLAGARSAYAGVAYSAFRGYWMNLPFVPAVGLVFGLGLITSVWLLGATLVQPGSWIRKLGLSLAGGFLSYIIWRNGIAAASQNYNFIPFLPSLAWWIMEKRACLSEASLGRLLWGVWLIPISLFIALTVVGAGYVRAGCLAAEIESRGLIFQKAKMRVDELKRTLGRGEFIMIDGFIGARSAVVLDGPPWLFLSRPEIPLAEAEKKLGLQAKYYLVLQYGQIPPEREDFTLIENGFHSQPLIFAGIKVASYTPGYGYAIYKRKGN